MIIDMQSRNLGSLIILNGTPFTSRSIFFLLDFIFYMKFILHSPI